MLDRYCIPNQMKIASHFLYITQAVSTVQKEAKAKKMS